MICLISEKHATGEYGQQGLIENLPEGIVKGTAIGSNNFIKAEKLLYFSEYGVAIHDSKFFVADYCLAKKGTIVVFIQNKI